MEKEKVAQRYIIVAEKAGIFYGEIAERRGGEVDLVNVRRVRKWCGACSISQLATDGTKDPSNCEFSVSVPFMTVLGVVEITPCSDAAMQSFDGVKIWKR